MFSTPMASRTRSDRSSTPSRIGGSSTGRPSKARATVAGASAPGRRMMSRSGPNAPTRPSAASKNPEPAKAKAVSIVGQVVREAAHADDLEVEQRPLRTGLEVLVVELLRGERWPAGAGRRVRSPADRARSSFTTTSSSAPGAGSRPSTRRRRSMSWRNAWSRLLTTAMSNSLASLKPMKKFSSTTSSTAGSARRPREHLAVDVRVRRVLHAVRTRCGSTRGTGRRRCRCDGHQPRPQGPRPC